MCGIRVVTGGRMLRSPEQILVRMVMIPQAFMAPLTQFRDERFIFFFCVPDGGPIITRFSYPVSLNILQIS